MWPKRSEKFMVPSCFLPVAEAEAKFGKEKLKIYMTSGTPMYHALTDRKTGYTIKLICVLPEEKVRNSDTL